MTQPRPCGTPGCGGQPTRLYPAGWRCDQCRPPSAAPTTPVKVTGRTRPAAAPGPCRYCGRICYRADSDGTVHECCLAWRHVIASGRPCPTCQVAALVARTGRLPDRLPPLPAALPDGTPYVPDPAPVPQCATCGQAMTVLIPGQRFHPLCQPAGNPSRPTVAEPDASLFAAAGHDASQMATADVSARAGRDASRGSGTTRRLCAWCKGPIPETARRDAVCCSVRCRQARHRFTRTVGRGGVADGRPLRLAYADPPYPGKARLYRGHPDYAGEVDHAALIRRLGPYDGWALSTSAAALPAVLALCPPGVRVAAWHRGERPTASWWPLHAWEPVIYYGGRPLDPSGLQTRRVDSLVCGVSPLTTLPGRVVGTKPAAFCRWIFALLGAAPGDTLDDLFPGSGAVTRAWAAYTGTADPSRPARADTSAEVLHDASGDRHATPPLFGEVPA